MLRSKRADTEGQQKNFFSYNSHPLVAINKNQVEELLCGIVSIYIPTVKASSLKRKHYNSKPT